MIEPEIEETLAGHSARALRVAWTPDAEPCLTTPGGSLSDSWSAALDELISNPHDEAAHERLLFYSRAQGSWGAYNLNLVRERFASLEEPDWYRDAVDIQVVWSVNQAVAFAPYDPAARRALTALRLHLPQHAQLARDVATNFPSTLAGQVARSLNVPDCDTDRINAPSAGDQGPTYSGREACTVCDEPMSERDCLVYNHEVDDRAGRGQRAHLECFEDRRAGAVPGPTERSGAADTSPTLAQPSPDLTSPQHLTNLVGADFPGGTSPRRTPPPRATTTHRPPFQMPCSRGIARDEGLGR